ncbi:MAG: hypothetical protein KF787_00450 [Phycisphaeraceae bacterium]|nr:hypothetical protein [Phycisphaerae bacterium]MBX3391092.1 hypothetical protein [Phycisphaeraceae bacterium]HRJ50706.1 hypothetical protein [Phycisphaerales bacterium]
MTAAELQDAVLDLIQNAIGTGMGDDDEVPSVAREVTRVRSYADAHMLTTDAGMVVTARDGREFQITIVRSR